MSQNPRTATIAIRSALVLGVVLAASPVVNTSAQNQTQFAVSVLDPRPLAKAADVLEQRHGWIITYEDPPFLYLGDAADVTRTVRRDYDPSKPKVIVPRGGPFDFGYSVLPSARPAAVATGVLEKLVSEYNQVGLGGEFRLVTTGEVFHFVPSASRDAAGRREARTSTLDVAITIPRESRTAFETLQALFRAVSEAHGERLGMGTVPMNLLLRTRLELGAENEQARQVLIRALATTKRRLSWRIFCDPGPVRVCAFNVHAVEVTEPSR